MASLGCGTPALAAAARTPTARRWRSCWRRHRRPWPQKKWTEALAKIKEAAGAAGQDPLRSVHHQRVRLPAPTSAPATTPRPPRTARRSSTTASPPRPSSRAGANCCMALNYQLKNYDKAIEYGQRAIKGGYATDENKNILAQAYYLKGDWKDALKTEEPPGRCRDQGRPGPQGAAAEPGPELVREARGHGLPAARPRAHGDLLPQARALEAAAVHRAQGDLRERHQHAADLSPDDRGGRAQEPSDYNEMAQLALEAGSPGRRRRSSRRASPATSSTISASRIATRACSRR